MARQQPVEQGGARAADVQRAGGRGCEPHAHRALGVGGLSGGGGNHKIAAMLIGAHVSPAGGLPKAIERGVQRGCEAIQIFNQSPRMWRPSAYNEEDVAAFREAMAASPVDAVLI